MQLPVPWPKLYCWAITPKNIVLHLYQTGYSYTAKQHRYLRELRLTLYRLSNRTYSHSLFLSLSLYTQKMQFNQYKGIKKTKKKTKLIITVRKNAN